MASIRNLARLVGGVTVAGLVVAGLAGPARADDVSSAQSGSGVARGYGLDCALDTTQGSASCEWVSVWLAADRSVRLDSTSLGGILTADPAILTVDLETTWVLGRGIDGALWYRVVEGDVPTEWTSLGGVLTSAPAIARDSGGRIHVFARGIDGALWTRSAAAGGSFGPWTSLGGVLTSDPDADTNVDGGLDVVVRGSDAAVWHRRMIAGTWGPWRSLGGIAATGPSIAYDHVGKYQIAVGGSDGAVYQAVEATQANWQRIDGFVTSDPELEFLDMHAGFPVGSYNYEGTIIVQGGDGRIYQTVWPHQQPIILQDGYSPWFPISSS